MSALLRPFVTGLLVTMSLLAHAQGDAASRDAKAIEVLENMSRYKDSLVTAVIHGASSSDARLEAGLMVANTEEITVKLKRPDSMYFSRFDGVDTKELIIHEGQLTLYNTLTGFYGQASTPPGLDPALDFALERLGIDLPLMDLIKSDTFDGLAGSADSVLYLTAKSRVRGVDCHHIVIRMAEIDVQLWVEEGNKPLPRRIMITSRWEDGAPRFVANMDWEVQSKLADNLFEFVPPDGSSQIDIIKTVSD